MDDFKKANQVEVDSTDYNVPWFTKRGKGVGAMLRRLARRRLKQELKKEFDTYGK